MNIIIDSPRCFSAFSPCEETQSDRQYLAEAGHDYASAPQQLTYRHSRFAALAEKNEPERRAVEGFLGKRHFPKPDD